MIYTLDTHQQRSPELERHEKLEKKLERELQTLAADLERNRDPGVMMFIKSSVMTRESTIQRIMSVKSARYHFKATFENDPAHHFRRLLIDDALRNLNDGPPNMAFEVLRVHLKALKLWQRLIEKARKKATEKEKEALRSARDRSSPKDETVNEVIQFAKKRRVAERDALGSEGILAHRLFLQEGQRRCFQEQMDRIKEAFDLWASWRLKRART